MPQGIANINFNDNLLADMARDYLKKYYDHRLKPVWLTRSDIKKITGMKSDKWIRDHIDNNPYVIANGLKFDVTNGTKTVPRYHEEIREFLKRFGR
ncbi:hypothetical protein [Loigolactobacillus backii]|uniref:hypothetical protein n=1 Tax=Loigolactobacillus backii TaxID=375175 RepID=UPI0007F063F4|nr:hypothetical protein [Loigolactobacillus backii]ANK59851.1 hypothetical protein AYR52_05995 [Loigolactobacillus backii]